MPGGFMFKVTKDWLHKFSRNGKGGWNAKQLRILQIDWPPEKGWLLDSIGMLISEEERQWFEQLAGQSQEGIKIDRGKANMAENPIYRTFPDGQGGWAGAWKGDARYPWTESK